MNKNEFLPLINSFKEELANVWDSTRSLELFRPKARSIVVDKFEKFGIFFNPQAVYKGVRFQSGLARRFEEALVLDYRGFRKLTKISETTLTENPYLNSESVKAFAESLLSATRNEQCRYVIDSGHTITVTEYEVTFGDPDFRNLNRALNYITAQFKNSSRACIADRIRGIPIDAVNAFLDDHGV